MRGRGAKRSAPFPVLSFPQVLRASPALGKHRAPGPAERAMIEARSNGSHHPRPSRGAGREGQDTEGVNNGTECRIGRAQGGQANDAGSIGRARPDPIQSRSVGWFRLDRTAGRKVAVVSELR